MTELSIGLQLFSVKNEMEKDLEWTLKRVSEIGYKNLEIPIKNISENGEFTPKFSANLLMEYLNKYDLNVIGTHVSYESNLNIKEVAEYNLAINSNIVVIPAHFYSTRKDVYEFATWLNEAGKSFKEYGINLYYHNHYHEFQEIDGEVIMDILIDETDSSLVSFEFDTFWAVRAGIEPVDYLERLGSRCKLVHQKDLNELASPVNLLNGVSGILNAESTFSHIEPSDFVEIDSGILDIHSIVRKISEMEHIPYIIVEQDRTSMNEFDSIEQSYIKLKNILEMVTNKR